MVLIGHAWRLKSERPIPESEFVLMFARRRDYRDPARFLLVAAWRSGTGLTQRRPQRMWKLFVAGRLLDIILGHEARFARLFARKHTASAILIYNILSWRSPFGPFCGSLCVDFQSAYCAIGDTSPIKTAAKTCCRGGNWVNAKVRQFRGLHRENYSFLLEDFEKRQFARKYSFYVRNKKASLAVNVTTA